MSKIICLTIGLFLTLGILSIYTRKEKCEEYTDEEMQEYIQWETEDYFLRHLDL